MSRSWIGIAAGFAGLALGLAGCGTLQTERPALNVVTEIASRAVGTGQQDQASAADADPRRALTREMIDSSPYPLLLVIVTERDAAASLLRAGENGDKVTWISPDGISIVLRNGFLVATRGLGDDLMAADVTESQSALRRGGPSVRVHDYLDGTDQVVRRTYECSFAVAGRENIDIIQRRYAVTRIDENCGDAATGFVNSYWIGADGTIWQSRQWVSPIVGSIEIKRL